LRWLILQAGEYMYKIYIDASDRKNNTVRLIQVHEFMDKTVDEIVGEIDLVDSIQKILAKHSLALSDIKRFEAFPGPGSFTGLKKAFAVTNVLNWALGINKNPNEFELPEYGKEPNIGSKKT
jgi:hypothetical protein